MEAWNGDVGEDDPDTNCAKDDRLVAAERVAVDELDDEEGDEKEKDR